VLAALREENQGLRETLSAQKAQLERYYAGVSQAGHQQCFIPRL
jgi:hypothetical protein